ncbi:MAG: DUF4340 domain-containing protein [Candidatus Aureabacteria bacterium]|nr:DUF4340 domain-containing protein [Candidatus Auribacterota bacterium]
MKFRTTLILIIIALGIGSYIWFFERKQMSTEEREQKGKILFSLKADDIDKIELVKEKETIVCTKDKDGNWSIEQPLKYMADKSPLQSICSRLESLNSERAIKGEELDEKKIEDFGLKKPRIIVRFRARGKEMSLALGEDAPLGESAYAQIVGDKTVYLVNKSLYPVLNKEVKDLRDRAIVEFEPNDLAKAQITHEGKTIEIVQDTNGWQITKPLQAAADPDKVSGMLRKIKNMRVRDFTDDAPKDLAKYGLDAPAYEVSLWDKKDQAAKTILVGKEAEKNVVYAKRGGTDMVFTVNSDFMKDLARTPEEMRDTKLTHLSQANIEEAGIVIGDKKLTLAKSGAKWEIKEPEKKEAEDAAVVDLLRKLTELTVTGFASAKPEELESYGLGKGAMEITLKPKEGDAEKFLVGKKSEGDKKVYVKRAKSDEILIVAADFLKDCSVDPLHYAKRQVLDFKTDDVKRIEVTRANNPKQVCEKGDDKTWKMIEPGKGAAGADVITVIISNLSVLRARALIAQSPKDLSHYGLDAPSCVVSLDIEKGGTPESKRLLIGGKGPEGTYYAKLADGDFVFTIPSYVVDNVMRDLAASEKPAPEPKIQGQKKESPAQNKSGD